MNTIDLSQSEKNEIAKHCWEQDRKFNCDQKKVLDRKSRLNA